MHISQDTIVAIQEAVQVEEVLHEFLSLQKKGKKYLCPFHQDKHPSFSITSDGKFYKCFSCGAQGGAISFLMDHQGMRYPEAMEYLAKKYGISWHVSEDSVEEAAQQKHKEALYILLEKAKEYYRSHLQKNDTQQAYRYLKERDLADKTLLEKFGLGYSLPEWRGIYDFATAQGYDAALLQEAGLILAKASDNTTYYDRFRGRLMFPIYNVSGKVIGFAGRHLEGAATNSPKYINSPETPVYQKSFVLYGLYQGKKEIKKQQNCYLVEGYTDVLALHQAGIENTVASGGTALTEEQITLLKRFTPHITLLFDGDAAGQQAAMRGIDLLLAQGCDVKIVCLPSKEDPDSFRRSHGNEALKKYLQDHIEDFITFKGDILFQNAGEDPNQQAAATNELLQTIAAIPDAIKRTFYIQSCSQRLHLHESLLQEKLSEILQKKQRRPLRSITRRKKPAKATEQHPTSFLERTLLYMLLHYADYLIEPEKHLADYLFEELPHITLSNTQYQTLWDLFYAQWHTSGPLSGEDFLAIQSNALVETARTVMKKKYNLSSNWEAKYGIIIQKEKDHLYKHATKNVKRLKIAHLTEAISQTYQEISQATTEEELEKLFLQQEGLKRAQNKLAKELSTVILST